MEQWLWVFALIGTVAFAVSGALTGIQKHMDLFGVVILALTTAVGGGVMRDLILGVTPPVTFQQPMYALVATATGVCVFLPPLRRGLTRSSRVNSLVMLLMDSLGLGCFTVSGVQAAREAVPGCGVFLLVFVGMLTGVGGGILRDILAGNTPYIFSKHIYACASLVGALLCALLWPVLPWGWAMLPGMAAVVLLRLLSAHFKLNLPRA